MSQLSGEELKKIRESKGIPLDKAATDLCLRPDLLRALESSGEIEILSDTYKRLSLQMYGRYLGKTLPGSHPVKSAAREVPLSPPVVLAYSDKLDPKVPKPKRRKLGLATLAVTAVLLFLASGLWSLNAKLARLTPKPKSPVAVNVETQNVEDTKAKAVDTQLTDNEILPPEQVNLDEELYLSLTPPAPPAEIDWH